MAGTAGVVVGLTCKAYRNTGTYGTPVWNEITICRDVSYPITMGEADSSARGSIWKKFLPTLYELGMKIQLLRDTTGDDYDAFVTALLARTTLDIALADAAIATVGTEYFRADVKIFGFEPAEPLENVAVVEMSLKPVPSVNADPAFYTVAS